MRQTRSAPSRLRGRGGEGAIRTNRDDNQLGFANSDYEFWVGAFAPAATPRAIVDRLNGEIGTALDTPGMRDRFKSIGGSATPMTAQAFGEQFKREIGVNAALVKAVGLQAN